MTQELVTKEESLTLDLHQSLFQKIYWTLSQDYINLVGVTRQVHSFVKERPNHFVYLNKMIAFYQSLKIWDKMKMFLEQQRKD